MPFLKSLPQNAHLSDLYSRFPKNVAPLMAYIDGILRGEGELTVGEREMIATFTSGLNACSSALPATRSMPISSASTAI